MDGRLLSGPYGLAVARTSSTSINTKHSSNTYLHVETAVQGLWLLLALVAQPQAVALNIHGIAVKVLSLAA